MSGKAVRETLGFLGVIASLIFVGLEIRQNTLTAQAAALQESTALARDFFELFALDAEAARIERVGRDGVEGLTEDEANRYSWIWRSFYWNLEGLYRQWDLGLLPDQEWRAWNAILCLNVSFPGPRTIWDGFTARGIFPADFMQVVASCSVS